MSAHGSGRRQGGSAGRSGTPCSLSVVVATHNRCERLKSLVVALEHQTLPTGEFELIVVDDGSTDGTEAFLKSTSGVRRLRLDKPLGPAVARERGWRMANGELVVFTDDDCRPEPEWLERLLAASHDNPGAMVQGATRPDPLEVEHLSDPLARSIRVDRLGPYFQTCNILYPRLLLERIDGFASEYAGAPSIEDTDLALRALGTGCGAVFAADAIVNHAVVVQDLRGAVRNARRWGPVGQLVLRHNGFRAVFPWRGRFWKESHWRLFLAFKGIALASATRRRAFLLWCVPYLTYRYGWSPSGLIRTLRQLPLLIPVDAAEVLVLARSSLRNRRLFL